MIYEKKSTPKEFSASEDIAPSFKEDPLSWVTKLNTALCHSMVAPSIIVIEGLGN